ncbi:MAG: ABC transporter permease [Vicinamibacterales bacterium]
MRQCSLLDDVAHACRRLSARPWRATSIIVILAVAIGANAAVFGVANALLLRTLPYADRSTLVLVALSTTRHGSEQIDIDGHGVDSWKTIRDYVPALSVAAFMGAEEVNVVGPAGPARARRQRVSAALLQVLGVAPRLGRGFDGENDYAVRSTTAVLSHRLWVQAFNADQGAVGQSVLIAGESHTVIGVMPPDFAVDDRADLWTPLGFSASDVPQGQNLGIVGRIRPSATWSEAVSEIASVEGAALATVRDQLPRGTTATLRLLSLRSAFSARARRPVVLLWAAVGVVLLVGCFNVACLQVAWGDEAARDIATRMALGASPGRISQQSLAEALVLSLCGGSVGFVLAALGSRGLSARFADAFDINAAVDVDWRSLVAFLALCGTTTVVCGLLPALRASQLDPREVLTASASSTIAGAAASRLTSALLATEVGLGLVLAVGAALFLRSLAYLEHRPLGFDSKGVVAASVSLQDARYQTSADVNRLFAAVVAPCCCRRACSRPQCASRCRTREP